VGRNVHVERLSEPLGLVLSRGRQIKKRTAAGIGVDERYTTHLLPGPEGECAECEGALEAKQGHKEEGNHEEDQIRRGSGRVIHAINRQHPL
jgi:hypothetical protein